MTCNEITRSLYLRNSICFAANWQNHLFIKCHHFKNLPQNKQLITSIKHLTTAFLIMLGIRNVNISTLCHKVIAANLQTKISTFWWHLKVSIQSQANELSKDICLTNQSNKINSSSSYSIMQYLAVFRPTLFLTT